MPLDVFISYAHEDQDLRRELEKHLSNLRRQHVIHAWYDGDLSPGTEWQPQILDHLNRSHIILLLVSANFMNSDFCYSIEMTEAIARHDAGQARVIPIILRPTDWKGAPFAKLKVLPNDGRPVINWPNHDDAFVDIVQGIREAVEDLFQKDKSLQAFVGSSMSSAQVPLSNNPYQRNPLFTGREAVLQHLTIALRDGKTTALSQPQAISGLGGIGKTQTAVEYAYRYQHDYDALCWVTADTRQTLMTDFVALAHLLNLPQKQEQDTQRIVEAVKRWFQSHSRWLLIFDNADDLTLLRAFLPTGGQGHILLTTRAHATARIAQRIELEQMGLEEGAVFLLHRANLLALDAPLDGASVNDQEKAKQIAQMMGGLPLALDQAGAYIEETNCSLSDYLQLYQRRQADLLKRRGRLITDHEESVATTLSLCFEKVQQANPAAANLLRFCAFLDPDAIPEEIITEGAPELGAMLHRVARDPLQLHEAIGDLLIYSLLRRHPDRTLTIHRLVQAVLKHGMRKQTQQRWAERAVRAVSRAFPAVVYSTWLHCQQYMPQVQSCLTLIEEWNLAFPEATQLLMKGAFYLRESAQYTQAEPLLQRALSIRERVLGPDHPETATSLNDLANLYYALGQYEKAEPFWLRDLTISERVLGSDHPDTATTLDNLASLYHTLGQYEKAEPLYQRALAIRERVLGPDHPRTAVTLNSLALLYYDQGKYERAEQLLQQALAIREHRLVPDHPDTATTLYSLARVYQAQNKYEQAESLYQRALAIYERVLGPPHPHTTSVRKNYTTLLEQMKPQEYRAKHEHEV